MKTTIAVLFLAAALACRAWARIGETLEQCEARYGKAKFYKVEMAGFMKEGMIIGVHFFEGKADWVRFEREDKRALSDKEIVVLMTTNGRGKEWKEASRGFSGDRKWVTSDGEIAALAGVDGALFIETRGASMRESTPKEAKEASALTGF